jgi:hypothetical protein
MIYMEHSFALKNISNILSLFHNEAVYIHVTVTGHFFIRPLLQKGGLVSSRLLAKPSKSSNVRKVRITLVHVGLADFPIYYPIINTAKI